MTAHFTGAKIRDARMADRLTQAQLADQLHVSSASIDAWECDRRTPNGHTLAKIADTLGVHVGFFFDDRIDPDPMVSKIVASFPPLSARQKERIAALLMGSNTKRVA